jgi:hypothetical protein
MRANAMKRFIPLIVTCIFLSSSVWAAEEVRPLGMSSATGGYSGDIRVGNTCTTSPLGKYYCGLNARHIYFYTDNTVDVDHLYPLAAANTGFPYVLGGTWTIDSAATYRGRLGTGTPDNTTFWRGDGAWGTPPGTTTTTLPWDNITSTPTTLAGYGITDYEVPTALPWDNITRTLSAGVTDTELSYVNNVTSAIQTQLNTKQAYNAGLAVLSSSTAYKMWISNGSGVITEVAFGADNTCWRSNGVSATPTWGTCGTGAGIGSLDNTTMDNTVIGGTTPVAATFTTLTVNSTSSLGGLATFATGGKVNNDQTLAFGTSSNFLTKYNSTTKTMQFTSTDNGSTGTDSDAAFYFKYASGVTIDPGKRIFGVAKNSDNVLYYVNDVGNTVQTGSSTATEFNSSGTDNTHFINVANTGAPNSGTETTGDCYYDNTTTAWLCWDGDSWEAPAFTSIGSGTNPVVDAAGEIAVDTTANQIVYYGSAEKVLDGRQTENATFKSPVSGDKAKFRKPFGMTVTSVGCVTDAATSAVLDVQECNADGASCSTILSATLTCGTTYEYTDGTPSVSDSAIAAGNYVFFSVGTVTGTVGYLYVDFNYSVTRQ